jgi:hypothetical protein
MGWATFEATFSQTHLVTLLVLDNFSSKNLNPCVALTVALFQFKSRGYADADKDNVFLQCDTPLPLPPLNYDINKMSKHSNLGAMYLLM